MKCIICDITAKIEPSYPVYEDNEFIAFLDKRPLFLGHTLLAPKNHTETLYDLDKKHLSNYFSLVQKLGKAVEESMEAKGSFIAINNTISQSIPHLHTHLVPRNPQDGLKGFFWPRTKYENEDQMREIQLKIQNALAK